jgi:hypothetical protein
MIYRKRKKKMGKWLRQMNVHAQSSHEVLQWGLDPLWDTLVPVSVSMLHSATEDTEQPDGHGERPAQDMAGTAILMVDGSRAITSVRVMGDVILVKHGWGGKLIDFTVDDGTGLLRCVLWQNNTSQVWPPPGIQLGKLLHVGGPVERYMGNVQLKVNFISPETHVDGMSLFWLQVSPVSLRPSRGVLKGCTGITINKDKYTCIQVSLGRTNQCDNGS